VCVIVNFDGFRHRIHMILRCVLDIMVVLGVLVTKDLYGHMAYLVYVVC